MAYQVTWAPSARLDLRELASYLAESRPQAAARFVQHVFQMVEHLADFPLSGRVVPEFGDLNIRELIRRPCRIVYRVKSKEQIVEIARVWHAARGFPQL
jgi:plasmid stabilization system protein ParE